MKQYVNHILTATIKCTEFKPLLDTNLVIIGRPSSFLSYVYCSWRNQSVKLTAQLFIKLKGPSSPLSIVYIGWSQSSYLSVRHMYSYIISEQSNHVYIMIKKSLLQSWFHYPFFNTHVHFQFTYCSFFYFPLIKKPDINRELTQHSQMNYSVFFLQDYLTHDCSADWIPTLNGVWCPIPSCSSREVSRVVS